MRRLRGTRWWIYAINFLFEVQWSVAAFYTASFLISRGVAEAQVGLVFSAVSVVAIFLLLIAPLLMRIIGNYRVFVGTLATVALASYIVGAVPALTITLVAYTIVSALTYLLGFSLDMFLEAATPDESKTGGVRALFLTATNIAIMVAPLLGAWLLGPSERFAYLFYAMAVLSVPIILMARISLKRFKVSPAPRIRWIATLRCILGRRDVRKVFFAQFLLRAFFALMVTYTALYLNTVHGIPLEALGTVFFIMLSPYVFLELPLGWLADTRLGEKELLALGFVLLAIPTALLSFMETNVLAYWAIALFATRVGAAFIDIMSETYFFKHVNGDDQGTVGAFRMLYPLAYLVGPALASLFLLVAPLQYLFVALAGVMLIGVPVALSLKDTR